MIRSFRKFFEFAGRQSQNWYLGLLYEIIRCILEALQFAALLVVLDGLVRDNITTQTALLAFGIMLVSVIGTIIFWYLAHGKEGEGSYRMCEDKRIQIGNRMKYMPMGYFNSHSLGNLTSVSTATMSDLESMSFASPKETLERELNRKVSGKEIQPTLERIEQKMVQNQHQETPEFKAIQQKLESLQLPTPPIPKTPKLPGL